MKHSVVAAAAAVLLTSPLSALDGHARSSMPTLARVKPDSDRQRWLLKTP